ncbi:MAG: flagellar biosynthesis regulator FlhF, partial [Loktanella sp.]|nr:flagellar biosynthesis regulator FlhF [Loktanella sp.]
MNAIEQARQAYAPTQIAVRTARAVEAQLLTQITTRLRQASEGGLRSFSELASVIHDNRRVWTTLAVSVADRDNQLPSDLRASL